MYFVTAPQWMRWLNPGLTWEMQVEPGENFLYLTFDDGPHPIATPFVLDQLKRYDAKATFFCIGKNVIDYPEIYQRILDEGHAVGNHTHTHPNGSRVSDSAYIKDVLAATEVIDSKLFRPPYGRISRFQSRTLKGEMAVKRQATSIEQRATVNEPCFSIIMWNVLSGDWDKKIDGKKCYENVVLNAKPGSIVVFHDSAKALERLQFALPKVLDFFAAKGFQFKKIEF